MNPFREEKENRAAQAEPHAGRRAPWLSAGLGPRRPGFGARSGPRPGLWAPRPVGGAQEAPVRDSRSSWMFLSPLPSSLTSMKTYLKNENAF